MNVCARGLWDESIPGIKFDQEGVSNFCQLQEKMMANYPRGITGQQDWNELVVAMKSAGAKNKYDCIIGVSGGVDSSYLLHIAHSAGLRPLAVNLDNGFSSEIAVQNIFKITSKLNIDLETYVVDYEEIKSLLVAYMRAQMPWIDTPTDLAIKAVMYKLALQEGIKYILRGNDFRSEGKQPKEWTYSDARQLNYIHRHFGNRIKLKSYPSLPLFKIVYAGLIRKVRDIRPYYYLDYQKQQAKDLLKQEYDWRDYGGHHHENLFTKFAMAYWLPQKFGIDKRKINLSAQVLSGVITRVEALNQLDQPFGTDQDLKALKDYTIKKLGLSIEEFEEIWSGTPKNTFDYPSNYKLIYGLVGKLKPFIKRIYAHTPMSITEREIISDSSPSQ